MKVCKKCNTEKDDFEFHRDCNSKDGYKNVCKQCLSVRRFKSSNFDRNIKQGTQYFLKYGGNFKWGRIVGYTGEELKEVIKNQFEPDMNFDNYGKVWCLSFFIPRTAYYHISFKNPEFNKLWSLKNIRVIRKEETCRQRQGIDMKVVKERKLFDILPIGDISKIIYNNENEDLELIKKYKKELNDAISI